MTTETYEILALKYAERIDRFRAESFLMPADDHATPHPMDYFVWVIRNNERSHAGRLRVRRGRGRQAQAQRADARRPRRWN